jgi:glutamate racemase
MSDTGKLPIGVFDSGVGGLTVVRALMERLPLETSLFRRYGPGALRRQVGGDHRAFHRPDHRLPARQGVKMLIIACNTMAAVASQVVKDKAGRIPCWM